jgi:hypothetical protein
VVNGGSGGATGVAVSGYGKAVVVRGKGAVEPARLSWPGPPSAAAFETLGYPQIHVWMLRPPRAWFETVALGPKYCWNSAANRTARTQPRFGRAAHLA